MVKILRWLHPFSVMLCAFIFCTPAFANTVDLRISGQDLQVGQVAQLQVVVIGQQPNGVPVVQFPQSGMNVQFTGQSSQVNSINGRTTRRIAYNFQLEALAEGSFQVGPATVNLGGTSIKTRTVRVSVSERVRMSSELLEAYAEWSTSKAWVGQVVLYRRGLKTRRPINQDSWSPVPDEGMSFVDEVQPKYSEYRINDPDGDLFIKEEIHPKIAAQVGTFEYPPTVARVAVVVGQSGRGLFTRYQTELEVLTVPATSLDVRPLPPAPPNFSGLVGEFTVTGTLEKTEATVGTSIPFRVTVEGEGALGPFDWSLDNTQKRARIYDGTPTRNTAIVDGQFLSRATFEQVIVPTEAGTLTLPEVAVVTFSPKRGEYVTHPINIPPIEVAQGTAKDGTLKTFVGQLTNPETLVREPAYEGVREAYATGSATRFKWSGWVQLLQLLTSIPLLIWVGWGLSRWIQRKWREAALRKEPKPFDPIAAIHSLPVAEADRWSHLEHVMNHVVGQDDDPDAAQLMEQLGAVRYGNKAAKATLEDDICAFIRQKVKDGGTQ